MVECESSATADYLYKACDGVEFESSSNVLDLRFIPDSMEFKHSPCDVATEVYHFDNYIHPAYVSCMSCRVLQDILPLDRDLNKLKITRK